MRDGAHPHLKTSPTSVAARKLRVKSAETPRRRQAFTQLRVLGKGTLTEQGNVYQETRTKRGNARQDSQKSLSAKVLKLLDGCYIYAHVH